MKTTGWRPRSKWIGVAAIGVIGLSALAWAATTGGVIDACVGPFGVLRLSENGECRHHEQHIRWNVSGPQGPAGPQGQPGATGPQGPAGPAGPGGGSSDAPNRRLTGHLQLDGVATPLDVSSYKFVSSIPVSFLGGGGGGGGKFSFNEVTVTTPTSAVRPTLLRLMARGQSVPSATLQVLDSTGASVVASYAFEEVFISGDSALDDGSADGRSLDALSLAFARITITAGGISTCWDLVQNRAC
jgi:type VI protein secretion system component Hcp